MSNYENDVYEVIVDDYQDNVFEKKHVWTRITRLRVRGGWLVYRDCYVLNPTNSPREGDNILNLTSSSDFVPDECHLWQNPDIVT